MRSSIFVPIFSKVLIHLSAHQSRRLLVDLYSHLIKRSVSAISTADWQSGLLVFSFQNDSPTGLSNDPHGLPAFLVKPVLYHLTVAEIDERPRLTGQSSRMIFIVTSVFTINNDKIATIKTRRSVDQKFIGAIHGLQNNPPDGADHLAPARSPKRPCPTGADQHRTPENGSWLNLMATSWSVDQAIFDRRLIGFLHVGARSRSVEAKDGQKK